MELLEKDPRSFGAAVKRLYLSGQAGGAGLRELLAYRTEVMETDQPEFNPASLCQRVWQRNPHLREGRARCCGLTPQPGRARGLRA